MKSNRIRFLLLLAWLLPSLAAFSQVDTAFWFAVPKLCSHEHWPVKLVVTTFDEPATITVTKPAMGNQQVATFTVPANSSNAQVLVQDGNSFGGFECAHNAVSNYGLYIHSTTKVIAYIAVQRNNSEIYALKGKNGLGTQFFVTMQYQYDNGSATGFGYPQARNSVEVIATEDNTVVTITPSATCGNGTHPANVPFTVTLNKGQVYCFASDSQLGSNHLCGSIITSNKPVAVDVTDDSVTPHSTPNMTDNDGNGSADLVADQLVPEEWAGAEYIVIPSPTALANTAPGATGGTYYLDYAFIFALEDNTLVRIFTSTSPNNPVTYTMNRGDKQKYHFTNSNPVYIYATNETMDETKNIFVFQITGAGKEFGGTQLPSLQCTGSRAVGYCPLRCEMTDSWGNYHSKTLLLTLLCQSNYTPYFSINGNSNLITASDWHDVPSSNFKYCCKNVTSNFAPTATTMVPFRVTNSQGEFHMAMFDVNGSYDDCSISYFSEYAPSSSLSWNRTAMQTEYCEGDTIFFVIDTVDVGNLSFYGPNGYEDETEPAYMANAMPEHTGMFRVEGYDTRGCFPEALKDSIWIEVYPKKDTILRDTICLGAGYDRFGFVIEPERTNEPGLLCDSLRLQEEAHGCDSLVVLELVIRDNAFVELELTSCKEYTWNGRTYDNSGDYQQTLTDVHGCDSLVKLHLEIVEPSVEIITSGDFCESGQTVLTAVSDYMDFEWSTGATTPSIIATEPGLYSVTVTEGDCQAATRTTIPSCEFTLHMPNAITPSNRDGLNDYLCIPEYVQRFISDFDIEIYDRWGELIFKTNNIGFHWSGENAKVSEVYVYVIRVKNLDGKAFVYKGEVTVL